MKQSCFKLPLRKVSQWRNTIEENSSVAIISTVQFTSQRKNTVEIASLEGRRRRSFIYFVGKFGKSQVKYSEELIQEELFQVGRQTGWLVGWLLVQAVK